METLLFGVTYSENGSTRITISSLKSSAGNVGSASGHASVLSAHNIDYHRVKKVSGGCCKSVDKQILTNISAVFKQGHEC
ncbi:hypothetical protein RRG08_039750 [Elysia crispata]|uniref:Uncharacterized protein n=1 Tax=Elysia crispata TaxID=231223 RepID=A0AAE1DMJ5_9GAST|nr:hypothetical protein RRG08_039750 [Elysia crispata]